MSDPEVFDAWRFEQPPVTVVLHSASLLEAEEWRVSVASEEPARRTVFVQEAAQPWIHVKEAEAVRLPDQDDLAAASSVLMERGIAKPGAEVKNYLPDIRLPDPLESPGPSMQVYSPKGLEQRLTTLNRGYFEDLVEQLRSPLGVMPFVGAGMSAKFGFPLWDAFLRDTANEFGLTKEVEERLSDSDYEGAAECLESHNPPRFTDIVFHTFRKSVEKTELRVGAISYLPLLTAGPLITTNFDSVLEDAFNEAGSPLRVIDGPREQPTVAAVHRNQRVLLKIHGTYDDRTFRVFTKDEYDQGYEEGQVTLKSLAWLTFTNRPLLFLGCSLDSDRTVLVLEEIQRQLGGLRHYAALAAHYSVSRLSERQRQLSAWGVSPLWYPPGQHSRITEILRGLVEAAATTSPTAASARPKFPRRDEDGLRGLDLPSAEPHSETRAVADAIRGGEVVFFLGAYAHLGQLPLGDAFYQRLATHFECPTLAGDRSAVAAFVASRRGPQILWTEVRKMLTAEIAPSAVYQVLSSLPAFLRARGQLRPTWIMTTNYDTVLEQQLSKANEPFHLLYYMQTNGLFAHVAPNGSMRVIERPEAIRELGTSETVVVKLNGGIVIGDELPESVVIASGQFERLAATLHDALPEWVRAVLRDRSLLFLGHGLAEPDVNRLIEVFAPSSKRGWWAVQLPPQDPGWLETWQERALHLEDLGLATIASDLEMFVNELRTALLEDVR